MLGGLRILAQEVGAGRRDFGPAYGALAGLRFIFERCEHRTEGFLLDREGDAGVLGPAHRRHSLNSVDKNREHWTDWDWSRRGEEWTSSEQWKRRVVAEVLERFVPVGGTVLEIGPGGGRWSEALKARADRLILVDLTQTTLELCRELLGDDHVDYVLNDGRSLTAVSDASIDYIWSFDAFVHIAPLDTAAYLEEFARVLRPGGGGLIHHGSRREWRGWRSPMSAPLFKRLAEERGLLVVQQLSEWEDGGAIMPYGDVLSVIQRPEV